MTGYIISRLFRAVVTMLLTVSMVFLFIRFSGDPAAALVPPDAPQEVIDQYAEAMGLDKPLWQQYSGYVGGLLQGNFGFSIHTGIAVEEVFLDRLPHTLQLGITRGTLPWAEVDTTIRKHGRESVAHYVAELCATSHLTSIAGTLVEYIQIRKLVRHISTICTL